MASTNSTTHYELSQYIGTDKPTYLVDYNQDMSKIDTGIYDAKSEADTNKTAIGTLSNLTTTNKTNLVSAVNEVNDKTSTIGDVTTLTTTNKTNLVSAVNEVNSKTTGIGDLSDLATASKTDLVSAINEVDGNVGNLSTLSTTSKASTVSAINELVTKEGSLNDLETTSKASLVSAINELATKTEVYSTSEVVTNKRWINGKTVYRKVIPFTTGTTAGDLGVKHGISDLEYVIDVMGMSEPAGQTNFYPLPSIYRDLTPSTMIGIYRVDSTQVVLTYGGERTNESGYIIIEYTKNDR